MSINAQEILDHCKAVVEGREKVPHEFLTVTQLLYDHPYFRIEWAHRDLKVFVNSDTNAIDCALAALLLGIYTAPIDRPAPVVLEWKRGIANYNSDIYATVQKEKNRTTWVSTLVDLKYGFTAEAQARAWCVEQITKIITPIK